MRRALNSKNEQAKSNSRIDWLKVAPLIISLSALAAVLYKDFFQGFSLHSSINQVVLLRVPGENKQSLKIDIILDDLLSGNPSKQAQLIIKTYPIIAPAIETKNRDKLKYELIEKANGPAIIYDPPDIFLEKYTVDQRYGTSFFVPMVVYNSGRKFAHVGSLVMIAISVSDSPKKWAFTPFLEVKGEKLLDRNPNQKDLERVSNMFSGFSVGPGESIKINPWFMPMPDANNKIISRENISQGKYKIIIFGYSPRGEKVLETEEVEYTLTKKNLLDSFMGVESVEYLNVEKNIDDALIRIGR